MIARRLAQEFKVPLDKAQQLLDRPGTIIKAKLAADEAEKLAMKFRSLDLKIELVKVEVEEPPTRSQVSDQQAPPPAVPPLVLEQSVPAILQGSVQPEATPFSESPESPESPATKECPFCAETILLAAKKCKHCKSDLVPPQETTLIASSAPGTS